jgi:dipeptidyl aminopeptidase/acylaminoacyl peptidase
MRPTALRVLLWFPLLLTLPMAFGGATALQAQLSRELPVVPMDPDRIRALYVTTDPAYHSVGRDFEEDIRNKAVIDSTFEAATAGLMRYRKITYPSSVDGLPIPAYLYEPLELRSDRGHPALLFIHGGVHYNWTPNYFPFIREAIEQGYVVIAPEYRGSTGYGQAHHDAVDYGGYEVEDVTTARDWMADHLPHVDPDRVGLVGWSHGGYIGLLAVSARGPHPFRAVAALVPVTNLIFRLSFKGPYYQHQFATQARIGGLPFERPEIYVERSPIYHVSKIDVPVLVHLADNDHDVNIEEAEAFVHTLRQLKPDLAETVIYRNPPGGHSFSREADPVTLEPIHSPESRDSWNRLWTFLEWNLRPYQDGSGATVVPAGG